MSSGGYFKSGQGTHGIRIILRLPKPMANAGTHGVIIDDCDIDDLMLSQITDTVEGEYLLDYDGDDDITLSQALDVVSNAVDVSDMFDIGGPTELDAMRFRSRTVIMKKLL